MVGSPLLEPPGVAACGPSEPRRAARAGRAHLGANPGGRRHCAVPSGRPGVPAGHHQCAPSATRAPHAASQCCSWRSGAAGPVQLSNAWTAGRRAAPPFSCCCCSSPSLSQQRARGDSRPATWCADGAKAGVGAEAAANSAAGRVTGQITLQEAKQILGIENNVTMEEILKARVPCRSVQRQPVAEPPRAGHAHSRPARAQRYQHIHDANEKAGSFYLQSKAFRAKEALERDLQQRAGGGGAAQPPP